MRGPAAAAGLMAALLAGCQHGATSVVHEKDPAACAEIAKGMTLHVALIRRHRDGACRVRVEHN